MIEKFGKQIIRGFKFPIFLFSTNQPPRIIKAKKLPQLQTQSVNLNVILQNLQLAPFQLNQQHFKEKLQDQKTIYFLRQISNINSGNYSKLLKQFENNNLFQHFFKFLSTKNKLGKYQQELIEKLVSIFFKMYINCNTREVNSKILRENFMLINKYFMFVNLNLKLIILFFKFSIKYRFNISQMNDDQIKYINDKFVFDYVLDTNYDYNFYLIKLMILYCSYYSLETRYFQKHEQIMHFLIKRIPKDWAQILLQESHQRQQKSRSLEYTLKSFLNINFFDKNMIDGLNYIVQENTNKFKSKQIILAIKILLQLREIKSQNVIKHLPLIKKLIELQPSIFFLSCITECFRASVWNNQIWIPFFQWLIKNKNFQSITKHFLYSIYCLMSIEKDLIPSQVINAEYKARAYLISKQNFRYDIIDSLQEFYKSMGQQFKTNMTVQQSFTNNLRLISQLQIKSQVLISMFFVDIVVGDNTVIQVNNKDHYIHNIDNMTYFYNLKSEFRKRILQKLGYQYIDIDVFQIKQGSFQLIQSLYKRGVLSSQQNSQSHNDIAFT